MKEFIKKYHGTIALFVFLVVQLFVQVPLVSIGLILVYVLAQLIAELYVQPDYVKIFSQELEEVRKASKEAIEVKDDELQILKKQIEDLENRFNVFKTTSTIKQSNVRF